MTVHYFGSFNDCSCCKMLIDVPSAPLVSVICICQSSAGIFTATSEF